MDVRPQAELRGDRFGDGRVVAGDHFDLDALLTGLLDGLGRIFTRRVEQWQNTQEGPGVAVVAPRHAQGAVAFGR
jgi:hypothetical protein